MAYRNDLYAIKTRMDELEHELREIADESRRIEALRGREKELRRELGDLSSRLRVRSVPMLDKIRVAAPCDAKWEDMDGDDRVRFCGSCAKNVYNLSAMTREAAEQLVRDKEGSLCVRFYRRRDGTVITSDCPIGARRRRRRNLALAVGGGAMLAAGAGLMTTRMGAVHQGDMSNDVVQVTGSVPIDFAQPPGTVPPEPTPALDRRVPPTGVTATCTNGSCDPDPVPPTSAARTRPPR